MDQLLNNIQLIYYRKQNIEKLMEKQNFWRTFGTERSKESEWKIVGCQHNCSAVVANDKLSVIIRGNGASVNFTYLFPKGQNNGRMKLQLETVAMNEAEMRIVPPETVVFDRSTKTITITFNESPSTLPVFSKSIFHSDIPKEKPEKVREMNFWGTFGTERSKESEWKIVGCKTNCSAIFENDKLDITVRDHGDSMRFTYYFPRDKSTGRMILKDHAVKRKAQWKIKGPISVVFDRSIKTITVTF